MRSSFRAPWIVAFAAALFAVAPSPVRAQASASEVKMAREMLKDAISDEKAGKLEDAIGALKQILQIRETAEVYLHLGECQQRQGHLVEALRTWEKAEDRARTEKDRATQQQLSTKLLALRERVPTVVIKIPGDARRPVVQVDQVAIPSEKLGAPLELDPGEHTLSATAEGAKDFTLKFKLAEKDSRVLAVELGGVAAAPVPTPSVEPVDPPPKTPTPSDESARIPVLTWVTAGAAVALTAGGVVSFVAAGSAASSGQTACATQASCNPSDVRAVHTLDTLALALWIGAGVGAGVSIYTYVSSRPKKQAAPEANARLVVGPGSVGLVGRF